MPVLLLHCLLALPFLLATANASAQAAVGDYPQVLVSTNQGDFVVELDARRAPLTARAFIERVQSDYYKDTIFHRVIDGFVVQGGGHFADYSATPPVPALVNESGNGLSNTRGTIAMARTNAPHSAGSQFFINVADNTRLDPSRERWGYAVFGQVVAGMDIVDKIAATPTGPAGPFAKEVPALPMVVKTMRVLSQADIDARLQQELAEAEALLEEATSQ
ncbi:MAG: peptidylprolyl isomerase [Pseudomonadota bacterium]